MSKSTDIFNIISESIIVKKIPEDVIKILQGSDFNMGPNGNHNILAEKSGKNIKLKFPVYKEDNNRIKMYIKDWTEKDGIYTIYFLDEYNVFFKLKSSKFVNKKLFSYPAYYEIILSVLKK